jgi:hypothetical protein
MRILPSTVAAAVTGAVVLPVFVGGMNLLDRSLPHGLVLLAGQVFWAVSAFFIPVIFSTGDMKYAVQRWREVGWFRVLASREDFESFYIPAWIRIGVMGLSALFSFLILARIGVRL